MLSSLNDITNSKLLLYLCKNGKALLIVVDNERNGVFEGKLIDDKTVILKERGGDEEYILNVNDMLKVNDYIYIRNFDSNLLLDDIS
ncbi:hypothetical protein BFU36_08540 [Sulfolobus sp. A20]|uniref:hypothetical protein n=1 Tax=Saccharolobus sp. A20 TaxID=1891280 RepID=UPI000845EF9D|nr:hypothetical protein [Sulfolobus sp. A20]TRM74659.1 hypothetical protein DJ532_12270 [Sulfolobus sp. A20-N-F8]TRM75971.1 hypothetical protein DJ528_08880 [Sulfolobus sp. B5]TRM86731.1 hypothetical protein DJ529_10525 [Sulfolobus sp. C3]TRM92008.1 hypothetical protein DJ526_06410 [Sulfolobus sp. A20-N-G8]TRM98402.1 hypothetical protein DJ530_10920 [Sulfolobus sp. E1]TRN00915.1 hypothetical protein DJ527_06425 [Sulfolobus sp. F1]